MTKLKCQGRISMFMQWLPQGTIRKFNVSRKYTTPASKSRDPNQNKTIPPAPTEIPEEQCSEHQLHRGMPASVSSVRRNNKPTLPSIISPPKSKRTQNHSILFALLSKCSNLRGPTSETINPPHCPSTAIGTPLLLDLEHPEQRTPGPVMSFYNYSSRVSLHLLYASKSERAHLHINETNQSHETAITIGLGLARPTGLKI